jgi:hypothetical protein
MRVIRVVFGFVLACLAAAVTLVLFVYTPAELASMPSGMGADRATEAGLFALVVTAHVAAFAALPALIGVFIAERRGVSSLGYYAILGVVIAALGFLMQHISETPGQTTILHNYALTAFLTSGLAGGLIYWLSSGRYVMGPAGPPRAIERPANTASGAAH